MTTAKRSRPRKRQLGQFLTPPSIATSLCADITVAPEQKILEPSFGNGSFLLPLIARFVDCHGGNIRSAFERTMTENVFGVELDSTLYAECLGRIEAEWGPLPAGHNLRQGDFFKEEYVADWRFDSQLGRLSDLLTFDLVIGNPPFGGTFDRHIEDGLDAEFGMRGGLKIKKETYSFFIVKCVEMLKPGGRLRFICSDTLLTIPTMKGLRSFLMAEGAVSISHLPEFSEETNYPMVVLDFHRSGRGEWVDCFAQRLPRETIQLSDNHSWRMSAGLADLFTGPRVGDFLVGTSGMTIGKNEFFVRPIADGKIVEPYAFEFFDDAITVEGERSRARLGTLSERQVAKIQELQLARKTRRNLRVTELPRPSVFTLPNDDYRFYNKSNAEIVYSPPDHVVFWKDEGDAVLTYKKAGNWYLRGVGGQPFFGREGLTWQLVSNRFKTRYLPAGYILDSGAPCGFLRDGVHRDELFFLLAWTLSGLCAYVLKTVINHTMNIQSKDFERLPYPYWVSGDDKTTAIARMKDLIDRAIGGQRFTFESPDLQALDRLFDYSDPSHGAACP